jgi:putative membrane protein
VLTRWLFAAVHLLGMGIGLGSAWARGRALRGALDEAGLGRVFYADNWWGVSALLLIGTGLVRAFGGVEKGSAYYLHNHLFLLKMTLLALILALELRPMVALIRWRMALRRGERPDTHLAKRFAATSSLQAILLVLMVLAATGMARGWGQ